MAKTPGGLCLLPGVFIGSWVPFTRAVSLYFHGCKSRECQHDAVSFTASPGCREVRHLPLCRDGDSIHLESQTLGVVLTLTWTLTLHTQSRKSCWLSLQNIPTVPPLPMATPATAVVQNASVSATMSSLISLLLPRPPWRSEEGLDNNQVL